MKTKTLMKTRILTPGKGNLELAELCWIFDVI